MSREIKVGMLVLAALVVLMAGTFFVLGVTAPGLLAPAAAGPIDKNQDD